MICSSNDLLVGLQPTGQRSHANQQQLAGSSGPADGSDMLVDREKTGGKRRIGLGFFWISRLGIYQD